MFFKYKSNKNFKISIFFRISAYFLNSFFRHFKENITSDIFNIVNYIFTQLASGLGKAKAKS